MNLHPRFELDKAARTNVIYSFVETLAVGRELSPGDHLPARFQDNHHSAGNCGFLLSETGLGLTLASGDEGLGVGPFLISVRVSEQHRVVAYSEPIISFRHAKGHRNYKKSDAILFQADLRPVNWLPLKPTPAEVGEVVYGIGHTIGFAISRGSVLRLETPQGGSAEIVTNCDTHHGFCGGPLVDRQGRCVGLGAASSRFEAHFGRRVSRGLESRYQEIHSLLAMFGVHAFA